MTGPWHPRQHHDKHATSHLWLAYGIGSALLYIAMTLSSPFSPVKLLYDAFLPAPPTAGSIRRQNESKTISVRWQARAWFPSGLWGFHCPVRSKLMTHKRP